MPSASRAPMRIQLPPADRMRMSTGSAILQSSVLPSRAGEDHIVALQPDAVDRRAQRGIGLAPAGCQVEAEAMPRTDDLAVAHLAERQRATIMRAVGGDGADFRAIADERDPA